ncbi:MAG: DNA gyrase inhibitor YacG [Planctomycetota bacterium]|jgi:endogenous inhibitor of DNA gyrase (YacG/DUF329 family)
MMELPVRCPTCRKSIEGDAARREKYEFYPFCGERCKLIDLGKWLDGEYRISDGLLPDDTAGEAGRVGHGEKENAAENENRG